MGAKAGGCLLATLCWLVLGKVQFKQQIGHVGRQRPLGTTSTRRQDYCHLSYDYRLLSASRLFDRFII